MSTTDDLKHAFAGECQAFRKYVEFGRRADQDGLPNVARLFRAAAEAERVHAEGHLAALGAVGPTAENLKAAIAGETHEYQEMYPPMLREAEGQGHKATRMFRYAVGAEAVHAQLYQAALEAVQRGEDLAAAEVYYCPVCGHLELRRPTAACPICGAKAEKYVRVN